VTTDNPKFHRGIPLSEASNLEGRVVPAREKILQQALEIVTKDRNTDYGNPEDNFATIAAYWTHYLQSVGLLLNNEGDRLTSTNVAAMMILMKVSRLATSPTKEDHWVDIAGYSACGAECANGNSR